MPACAPGFQCDTTNGTCVPMGGNPDGGGGPDAAGGCMPACGGGTPYCNSSQHCVACITDGNCPAGNLCKVVSPLVSSCVPGCNDDNGCRGMNGKPSLMCCTNRCADTDSDLGNCGACGNVCNATHAAATCSGGKCALGQCNSGWGDCNNDPKDGCETNLHLDNANCTMCGMGCALDHAVAACSDGCYITACNFGWDDCNQNTDDGCETSVLSDPGNCGACGNPCNGLPNAAANCTAGNCVLGKCNPGFADCNGDPTDGCEVNLQADGKNCNGCGNVCPMNTPACANGQCGILFTFSGVMNNVPINSLGGWTQCFVDVYGDQNNPSVNTILQMCPGSNLLMGCRMKGSQTLLLAAEAPRADVLFDEGQNAAGVHMANGTGWYFSASYSWGFVKGGDTPQRNSCDVGNTNPDQRLCWHSGGGTLNGGYRCGSVTGLNGDQNYERILFTSM
jgi:hypothetical protein